MGVSSEVDFSDVEYYMSRGTLVILPLNTEGDRDTDEDSGDENELHLKNLSKSNLLAGASFDLSISSDNIGLGAGDKEDVAGPSVDVPSKGNRRWKVNAFL